MVRQRRHGMAGRDTLFNHDASKVQSSAPLSDEAVRGAVGANYSCAEECEAVATESPPGDEFVATGTGDRYRPLRPMKPLGIEEMSGPRETAMVQRRLILAAPALLVGAGAAQAQTEPPWPNRPLRMIIPWPPGQSTDVQGRLIAQLFSEKLGQFVVPENRAGAGGQIGTNLVAKAPPDGYTLLAASVGPISFSPLVQRTPYDVERELAPVASYGLTAFILLVRPDFPATDLRSFLRIVRANPGKYSFSTSGVGGAQHLVTALFNAMAGIDALHVPFQGSAPSMTAMLGGNVDFGFDTAAAALRLVREGKLRAFGISTVQPSRLMPEIPSLASVGGPPDYDIGGWNGLMVPAGTPRPIIDRLWAEVRDGLATPQLRERFETIAVEVGPRGPAEFATQLRELWDLFAPLIRDLGIRVD
jgi:tripartite-type tricarboxylate transporter receptor subunit TctC